MRPPSLRARAPRWVHETQGVEPPNWERDSAPERPARCRGAAQSPPCAIGHGMVIINEEELNNVLVSTTLRSRSGHQVPAPERVRGVDQAREAAALRQVRAPDAAVAVRRGAAHRRRRRRPRLLVLRLPVGASRARGARPARAGGRGSSTARCVSRTGSRPSPG